MSSLIRCLSAFALLGLLSSCQLPPVYVAPKKVVKPVPARFVLTHGPSGIKFLPQVGELHRQGKATGVEQKSDLTVSYKCTDLVLRGRGSVSYFLSAMVGVTSANASSPAQLRADVLSKIEDKYPDATHESIAGPHGEADYLTYSRPRSEFTNRMSNSKAAFQAAHPTSVELHAYQRGEFTIIYRFEYSTVRRSEFSKAIAGFMKTFEVQQGK